MPKYSKFAVAKHLDHYLCVGCGDSIETAMVFNNLYYCEACHEATERRERLKLAIQEFDESPDETVE